MATWTERQPAVERLTRNQVNGFLASWGGWLLDGMDSSIFALVLTPALTELLPKSGIAVSPASLGLWGGVGFALFLVGWGLSTLWGPVADRFGRARTLMWTILVYSLFTFLAGFAQNVWELMLFRFLAGLGIGGEWSMGDTFVAEEWPESRRKMGAGYLHTGYYIGFVVAALLNLFVTPAFGWRVMFWIGIIPAFLVAFIRYGVREPERWQRVGTQTRREGFGRFLSGIFAPHYLRRTVGNALLLSVAMIGLWAGTVYLPTAITQLATAAGLDKVTTVHLASYGTMLTAAFTVVGCLLMPLLAERIGRRATLAFMFLCMFVAVAGDFGWVFYHGTVRSFYYLLPVLGLGGADFAVFTLWLPEQYSTDVRATAFAFATSIGRFLGAAITFLVGAGVSYFHSLGTPIALTSVAFLVGLALLGLAPETRGHALPD